MFGVGRENKLGRNLESRKQRGIILLDGFFVFWIVHCTAHRSLMGLRMNGQERGTKWIRGRYEISSSYCK